jgi:KDO2-lipid IV(A) lauroyltransferase
LISEILTLFIFHIIGYRKKVVYNNLSNSFPEKSKKEIKHIARKYYRHLSVMIVENIYLRFISTEEMKNRLILENREIFDELYDSNRNIIVMLGHFGNWEFAGGVSNLIKYKGVAVYKKLSSGIFDKIYFDIRTKVGVEPIEMRSVLKEVIKLNSKQQPYMLFMVADQAPNDRNSLWIKFLNQSTDVFIGAEKIAKKFNMPVVYLEVIRHKKGIYRLIPQIITTKPTETEEFEITKQYFRFLEKSIVKSPRYWLWSHRRWKHTKS